MSIKLKKTLSLILSVVMLLSAVPLSIAAETEAVLSSGSYSYTLAGNDATITGYSGTEEKVEIPGYFGDYTVVAIAKEAFLSNSQIKEVTIPNSVVSIGEYAFYNCVKLETVNLGSGITSIGNNAFKGCSSFVTVNYNGTEEQWSDIEIANTGNGTLTDAARNYICLHTSKTEYVKKDSTCTEVGNEAYWVCNTCSKIFLAETNEETTADDVVIAAKGHIEEEIPAVAATCTTPGSTAGAVCSVCDFVITEVTEIPALGHTEEEIPAVAATCTTAGATAGVKCSVCNTIIAEPTEIPATGHTWVADETLSVPATCTTDGRDVATCSVCGENKDEVIKAEGHKEEVISGAPADCTISGVSDGKKCTVCGEITVEPEQISALGHTDENSDDVCDRCYAIVNADCWHIDTDSDFVCDNCDYSFDIKVDEKKVAYVNEYEETFFRFVPAKSGSYVFRSYGDNDTYGTIYNSSFEAFASNDDDDETNNFAVVATLRAGQTYYYGVRYNNIGNSGSYPVELICDYYVCDHIDEDDDCICDICGEEALIFAGNYADTEFKLYVNGTLKITGEGRAYCRWKNYREYIKKVVVGEGITALNNGLLAVCPNLTEVVLPESLEEIGDEAFYSCPSLKNIDIPDGVYILGESVFSGCIALEKLEIPEGIQDIRYYFASGCTALKEVILPDSITWIGEGAFAECTALEEIELPLYLESIHSAFRGCTALKNFEIPENLRYIGNEAFANCDSLTEVIIPETVEVVAYAAFALCDKLEKVDVNCYEIGDGAFAENPALKQINIGSNVGNIYGYAFGNCDSLEEVTVPETVFYLGECVFIDCDNLKKATLGARNIGYEIFGVGSLIEEIILLEGVESIEGSFIGCLGIEKIKLPDSLISLDYCAFGDCRNLKEVDFGKGISYIGYRTFENCIRLSEVNLPETVEAIVGAAFRNCIRLTKIVINNPDCAIESSIDTIPEDAMIYGYDGSTAEEYADDWLRAFTAIDGEHKHNYIMVIEREADCTQAGIIRYTCRCGATYTEDIEAKGHVEEVTEGKAPTCTEDGLTDGIKCKVCGNIIQNPEKIPATGHNMIVDEEKSYAANCSEVGMIVRVCTNEGCTHTETEETPVDKDAHIMGEAVVTKEVTCTENGEITIKCELCDKTEKQVVKAGHNVTNWSIVTEPTCISEGEKGGRCIACGFYIRETLAKIDHIDNNEDRKCDYCDKALGSSTTKPEETTKPDSGNTDTEVEEPEVSPEDCNCPCHSKGFRYIWHVFFLFFQKLIGTNKVCACGKLHY